MARRKKRGRFYRMRGKRAALKSIRRIARRAYRRIQRIGYRM